jgi:hypothetical protein
MMLDAGADGPRGTAWLNRNDDPAAAPPKASWFSVVADAPLLQPIATAIPEHREGGSAMRVITQAEHDRKLREARALLAAHGMLTASSEVRRPVRTTADARRRLATIAAEQMASRRQRLAAVEAEVRPSSLPTPSVGWRLDFQGRVRPACWATGEVVVRTGSLTPEGADAPPRRERADVPPQDRGGGCEPLAPSG